MSVGYRNERAVKPSRFKLILVQGGEGCDYTIGCGIRVESLRGETLEDAKAEAKALLCDEDEGLLTGDGAVAAAFIADCEELPIAEWAWVVESARLLRKSAASEAAERAELERLQAKYKK